jgi:hypothetical protein
MNAGIIQPNLVICRAADVLQNARSGLLVQACERGIDLQIMKPIFIAIHVFVLLLILLFTTAPIISVAVAGWIAESNGCILNESQPHPCIVNGVDQGDNLYALGVMGWFMLVTIPLGGLAFIVYVLILVGYLIVKKLRQKSIARAG